MKIKKVGNILSQTGIRHLQHKLFQAKKNPHPLFDTLFGQPRVEQSQCNKISPKHFVFLNVLCSFKHLYV